MRSLTLLATCMTACLLLGSRGGCGGGENAYIMSQMHLVTTNAEEEVPSGFTCADVSAGSGSSSSGSTTMDDFWMSEESSESGLSVKVGSFEQTLEQRLYDRAFIAAHQVDRFLVTTQSGAQYAFVYWGSDSCESCPPPPFEPLPGDPFGCGNGPAQ